MAGFMPLIMIAGSAIQGMSQASAARQQADAQSKAYEYNAAVARNNATAARNAALVASQQQDRQNSAHMGKLTTSIIKQGVAMEGTPLLILDEEFAQGKLESKKKIYQGEVQATNYENDANLQGFYSQEAQSAGESKAGQSILGGAMGAVQGIGRMFGGK